MISEIRKMKNNLNVTRWMDCVVCGVLSIVFSIGVIALLARFLNYDVCTWNKYRVAFLVILFSVFLYKILRKKEGEKIFDKSRKPL